MADFETVLNATETESKVYLWALVGDGGYINHGYDIESFIDTIRGFDDSVKNVVIYFHNLRFDGSYIVNCLLKRKYELVKTRKDVQKTKQFTVFIDDQGAWYSIDLRDKKRRMIHIYDSFKKIPLGVQEIGDSYKCGKKGIIDYNLKDYNYNPTIDDVNYCINDCQIVYFALKRHLEFGYDKITLGSDCMQFYKKTLGGSVNFKRWFPNLDYYPSFWGKAPIPGVNTIDEYCRRAYKGAWCYVNPDFEGKILGDGIVVDANSLYPYVLAYNDYPVFYPTYKVGVPPFKADKKYIFRCELMFELKKDGYPCIIEQNKGRFLTESTWLASSNGQYVEYTFTDVDFDIIKDNYIYDIMYIDYLEFDSMCNMFTYYIEHFNAQKEAAAIDGDYGLRQISKLFNNNLYGKFGQNNSSAHKLPMLDEGEALSFVNADGEPRKTMYVPVAAFCTAYARQFIISYAKKIGKRFAYADTDSLHFVGKDIPPDIPIDPVKLGAFKVEYTFRRAKYLRQKVYIEDTPDENSNYKLRVTAAGLKKEIFYKNEKTGEYKRVDRSTYYSDILGLGIKDFKRGLKIPGGKTVLKQVKGGCIVKQVDYSII